MSRSGYIFDDAQHAAELERLQAIEAVFDPATERRLLATGLAPGWRCLEVGAGAGSIARWMSARVGAGGYVAALDKNPRFLRLEAPDNLAVIEGDIRTHPLEAAAFDLVHARYVLIHIADAAAALSAMVRCLKPGGWLVLEEPDFSVATTLAGDSLQRQAFDNVYRAIEALFATGGMDHAFGARIPQLLADHQLESLDLQHEALTDRGGSPLALMMHRSTDQLADKYIATGKATGQDIDEFLRFTTDDDGWAVYYAHVSGSARKG